MTSGSKPSPSSRTQTIISVGVAAGTNMNSIVTNFASSDRFPCLMALITDSRTATPTQCTESSSRPAICPMRSLTS